MNAADLYLETYLSPLSAFLARADVTDIYINGPQAVWVECKGGSVERHEAPRLTRDVLERLARQIAAASAQGVNREHPLLSAALPDGSRVQIVVPPATRGEIAIAIRKQVLAGFGLGDLVKAGAFSQAATKRPETTYTPMEVEPGGEAEFLARAVRQRRNILVSGGTSTGKTTFLNALLKEIPNEERIILIEDTPELELTLPNAVGLIAARSQLREALVTTDDLLTAALRMRPDRIILGELRGQEAFSFLRAVNTGHPGSMTTIHADSPDQAIEQLALLVLQSGVRMSWDDIARYVRRTIDVYVQLERRPGGRGVSAIFGRAPL